VGCCVAPLQNWQIIGVRRWAAVQGVRMPALLPCLAGEEIQRESGKSAVIF